MADLGNKGPPPPPAASGNSGDDHEAPELEPIPAVPLDDPRVGTTLAGRYRIDRLVGKGGMGRVYRATQFPLNRPVAIKILNPEFQKKDPQFVRRFFLEAASAARLSHPNTITVFDYGEGQSGELFIVMEYLKGRPLSKIINAEKRLSAERTLHIGMQICRALREAHQKGIIHRDLKPGNILLLEEGDDADFVKVLDFGLVKLFVPGGEQSALSSQDEPLTPSPPLEADLTKAGMFLGSPKYMSPEQIQGVPLDPRTDIYSLGVLLFQMLTGKPPFTGATSVEVIYKHVNQPVPHFAELGVEVAPELEAMVRQMLAKRRDERFESMAELLVRMKDVRRLVTGASAGSFTADVPLADLAAVRAPAVAAPVASVEVVPEAAFAESAEDDTGSLVVPRSASSSRGGLPRVVAYAAAGTLLLVLGVAAYVVSAPGSESSRDPALAEPKLTEVHVTSEPAGAEVYHRGALAGRTPLVLRLPAAGLKHELLLKKPGHADARVERVVAGDRIDLAVTLEPSAGPEAPPPSKAGPGEVDYKENPY